MATNTPKTMSSRLMTMKFMQRSAAKNTASSPSTPNGPPSKKVRLSNGHSAPGTPDHEILQSGLDAEAKRQQEALDKAAQHAGETKWVLSFQDPLKGKREEGMKVKTAGFAELDAEGSSSEEEEESRPIRKKFGGGVKRTVKPVVSEAADESEGEGESSSEEYDSDDPTAALIRETKREVASQNRKSRDAQRATGDSTPRKPIDEDMNLSGMQTLSGGRGPSGRDQGARDMGNVDCFKCGQKGHIQSNCPKARGSAGRGRGKARR